jgi:hypothetical protein
MSDVNWTAIQADYEQGELSQSALAKKHGVSRTAIQKRAMKEAWQVAGCRLQVAGATTPLPPPPKLLHLPIPDDAVSIARIGLHQLAQHLQSDTMLEVRDHKSLSDALAQYVKVLQTAPQEPESKEGLVIPLEKLSPSTRQEIRRLLVEDARQQGRTG